MMIRSFDPDRDVDSLRHLHLDFSHTMEADENEKACEPVAVNVFMQLAIAYIQSDQGCLFMMEHQEETVGYAFFVVEPNQRTDGIVGTLAEIYVAPAWRRNHFAKSAVVEGLRWLQDHGIDQCYVSVYKHNLVAISFYEKMDFLVSDYRMLKVL
nr:GNAT family N-acetyltransferase [Bacilli bacterium]